MRRLAALAAASFAACCSALAQAATEEALLKKGEEVYGRCLACHDVEQNRTGPAHCGLFGRRAGTAPGYEHYSDALKKSGIVWDDKSLARFLADPMTVVPGTNMTYLGVTDAKEREALIAWMKKATQAGKACRLAR